MPIRILLAQLPNALQATIERALSEQSDMVVNLAENHVEVLLAVGQTQADVVVIGMEHAQPPGIVSHLLDEYPILRIILVDVDDHRGFLYELRPDLVPIGDVSSVQFPVVVRAVVRDQEGA
jgi:DNA-binding NarL/FixJ family response regulator